MAKSWSPVRIGIFGTEQRSFRRGEDVKGSDDFLVGGAPCSSPSHWKIGSFDEGDSTRRDELFGSCSSLSLLHEFGHVDPSPSIEAICFCLK